MHVLTSLDLNDAEENQVPTISGPTSLQKQKKEKKNSVEVPIELEHTVGHVQPGPDSVTIY